MRSNNSKTMPMNRFHEVLVCQSFITQVVSGLALSVSFGAL
jgi:hypothetical protein